MNILIIGGTSFIGYHLLLALHCAGHRITILNRGLTPAKIPESTERIVCDRGDSKRLQASLRGREFDVTYDLIAYHRTAVEEIARLLEGRIGRYVLLSTSAVYGTRSVCGPIDEDVAKRPDEGDEYGLNKLRAEETLLEWVQTRGFPGVIVRPYIVYGPRDNSGARGYYLFQRIHQDLPIVVPGFPRVRQNMIYVKDLVNLLVLAGSSQRAIGQDYNAVGPVFRIEEYLRALMAAAGREVKVRYLRLSLEEYVNSIYPESIEWHLNCFFDFILRWRKAEAELGWAPRHALVDGLCETYDWLLENRRDVLTTVPPTAEFESRLFP